MSDTFVSIGMPVYNNKRFIGAAIESVLSQDHQNFELIISDNASTDTTPDICHDYVLRDSRINYTRNKVNMGSVKNFNKTFQLAKAPYFMWAAGDDLCAPKYLSSCLDVLKTNSKICLCYSRVTLIDDLGRKLGETDDHLHLPYTDPVQRCRKFMWHLGMATAVYGLMRSDILRQTRLFQRFVSSDYLLLFDMLLHGGFYQINEPLFLRRRHQGQAIAKMQSLPFLMDPDNRKRLNLRWSMIMWHTLRLVHNTTLLNSTQKFELIHEIFRCFTNRYGQQLLNEITVELFKELYRLASA